MIVYGDPSFEIQAGDLLDRLRRRAEAADPENRDDCRTLLIEAGQWEQALADRVPDGAREASAMRLTGLAAGLFLGFSDLAALRRALAETHVPPELRVRVKVPEGFAFYTLYPEQYARAAGRWVREHRSDASRPALVVGIRSIGTSLSAVVAAVLGNAGWRVRRVTVRPGGHPYDRRVSIAPDAVPGDGFGLVVDEGPGRSGSSMAAVARALAEAGCEPSLISFLPGHDRGPGPCSSAEVQHWWDGTRRFVTGLDDVEWNGKALEELLALRTGNRIAHRENLGGGLWRRVVFPQEGDWPPSFGPFERSKFRVVREDGSALLWKFEGLGGGAEETRERMAALAQGGWTPAPVDSSLGFVARPWIAGEPLRESDAREQPGLLEHVGRYIAAAAGPLMTIEEQHAALERLREMLDANTRESLGEAAAQRARRGMGLAPDCPRPSYGDGRLGPEEWLRDREGRLWKVDCAGHDRDHTVIGRQPWIWDVAGAVVEWGLDEAEMRPLVAAFAAAGGESVAGEVLAFYRMAYAAFRLGQCSLCADMSDAAERSRLNRAAGRYRTRLATLIT